MPYSYTKNFRNATPPRTRRNYARGAVFREFRLRDAKALDHDGFRDRQPSDEPVRLDHIAAKVVGNAGQAALDNWLREAARTTGPQHDEAMRIAREIAGMIGVDWGDIYSGEAA